jgi:glycosyltransferase involved in cell wall biosynthesis
MQNHISNLPSLEVMPLVTIVVPTIGRPLYIVNTVHSILAQTYSKIQILISDNKPEISTAQLLEVAAISDNRIDIVTRTKRLDFSAHMNLCIAEARGTYVMILSDDDQITPGYVEEALQVMQSRPEIIVCLGRQIKVTKDDYGVLNEEVSHLPQFVIDGTCFLRDSLSGNLQTGVLTYISMFARKMDIIKSGGFQNYPDGLHSDNFLIFNLALRGHIALLRNLMFYRVYLESSGLKTPFSALILATKMYTNDCARMLYDMSNVSNSDKSSILHSLKSDNAWLLLSRIRHVYRHQLSFSTLVWSVLQVVWFWVR